MYALVDLGELAMKASDQREERSRGREVALHPQAHSHRVLGHLEDGKARIAPPAGICPSGALGSTVVILRSYCRLAAAGLSNWLVVVCRFLKP